MRTNTNCAWYPKLILVLLLVGGLADGQQQRASPAGTPNVFELLLQSKPALHPDAVSSWLRGAAPGASSHPTLTVIPTTSFSCEDVAGPGYYADPETQCQVFHRCDRHGVNSSYLCASGTIFNQITLTCDWWYNIDCNKAKTLYEYTNSRLYMAPGTPLFESPPADWQAPVADTQPKSWSSSGARAAKLVTSKGKVRRYHKQITTIQQ
ncbi:hypothetical protein BV898_09184 [Hypsibius exemplaris]|uniref:Chitin-binding type-2 domain-containing protein n=1 Tax=Hypsibius exemplaris TaxID=2072580 RepID=A0A1W0WNG7_HYPEX|nr:hypothetical protein BV898_09184 [Hypsibius exemplaris]